VREPVRVVSRRFEGGSGPYVRHCVHAVRPLPSKVDRALRSSVQ
jgi:hypothetical protein